MRSISTLLQTRAKWLLLPLFVLFGMREAGCDYSLTTPPPGATGASKSIVLTPIEATINIGDSLSVHAVVSGLSTDSSVRWKLLDTFGSIEATGNTAMYHAPASIPSTPQIVRLQATANGDTSLHATCQITLLDPNIDTTTPPESITVSCSPISVKLQAGQTQQFVETVVGAFDESVTWQIVSGPGVLSEAGLYTAPSTVTARTTVIIQVTSVEDTSAWARSTITLVPPPFNGPCFKQDILPIFVSNCAMSGCHDAQTHEEGYTLTSYAGVMRGIRAGRPNNSKIYEKIVTTNPDDRMPPPPHEALTADQIKAIGDWITAGAPNSDCTPDPADGCDSASATYSTFVKSVIQSTCLGCHSSSVHSGGIILSTYDGVRAVALSGKLVGSITHASGYRPMPDGLDKLDDCTIASIRVWVAHGAPND